MAKRFIALAAAAAMAAFTGAALAGGGASGTWIMDNGKVTVRIADCGGNLCGTIVALKKPLTRDGRPKRDKENPQASLRGRPVIGLTILQDLQPDGANKWVGMIYNPDDGYTYDSKVKLVGSAKLRVQGCFAFVCKTMNFSRVN